MEDCDRAKLAQALKALATAPSPPSLSGCVIITVILKSVVLENVILYGNSTWCQIIQYKRSMSFFLVTETQQYNFF